MTPFFVQCQPDEDDLHEVLQVTVPTHVLRAHLSDDVATGFSVSAERREFAIAEHILLNLLEDDGQIAPDTAEMLVNKAILVLGMAIRDHCAGARIRQTLPERRLEDVLRFIEVHLSDPNLSTSRAANGCGISARYLAALLQRHGTSFTALVWDQRLANAQKWLSSSSDTMIAEVAYGVGFKSPAHFSRMFKRAFNINPRDYRADRA
jgi:AraC-like DNA-binding protein